jgi:hypothetical protein
MKARALVCAVLVVLLAGACSDEQDSVPLVEKDVIIGQADAICKAAAAELTSLSSTAAAGTPTADEARELLNTKLLPRLDQELGDLKDLGEPKADRREWDDLVKAFDAAVSTLKRQADEDPLKALTDSGTLFADANARAKAFGLKECGKS